MNLNLYYNIAEFDIVINTPDAEYTSMMLPTYVSFRVQAQTQREPLFVLSGDHFIKPQSAMPKDEFESVGIRSKLYDSADGSIVVAMKINGKEQKMEISPDKKFVKTTLSLINPLDEPFLGKFILIAFGIICVLHKAIKIHASVIVKNDKALIFLGKSGTGKSTHSKLWQRWVPNCWLLNDDEPIVRIHADGSVVVYGAPWSGSTPCYIDKRAKVSGFVHLYQNSENKLTKLSGLEAFQSLFMSAALLHKDEKNKETIFNTIANILDVVPVYKLNCLPDKEAVQLTEKLI